MSDEIKTQEAAVADISRRDSIRLAAALALGAGLGVPSETFGKTPTAVRLQVKFYKSTLDGGDLVGSVELSDAVTAFIGSVAGSRTQIKWFDWYSRELGTMGIPSMIQDKTRSLMLALPPGE